MSPAARRSIWANCGLCIWCPRAVTARPFITALPALRCGPRWTGFTGSIVLADTAWLGPVAARPGRAPVDKVCDPPVSKPIINWRNPKRAPTIITTKVTGQTMPKLPSPTPFGQSDGLSQRRRRCPSAPPTCRRPFTEPTEERCRLRAGHRRPCRPDKGLCRSQFHRHASTDHVCPTSANGPHRLPLAVAENHSAVGSGWRTYAGHHGAPDPRLRAGPSGLRGCRFKPGCKAWQLWWPPIGPSSAAVTCRALASPGPRRLTTDIVSWRICDVQIDACRSPCLHRCFCQSGYSRPTRRLQQQCVFHCHHNPCQPETDRGDVGQQLLAPLTWPQNSKRRWIRGCPSCAPLPVKAPKAFSGRGP